LTVGFPVTGATVPCYFRMAKCTESHLEPRFHANQAAIFPQKIEFSLYFSLLLAETTSRETASTTKSLSLSASWRIEKIEITRRPRAVLLRAALLA
jgi:hypothetical protein